MSAALELACDGAIARHYGTGFTVEKVSVDRDASEAHVFLIVDRYHPNSQVHHSRLERIQTMCQREIDQHLESSTSAILFLSYRFVRAEHDVEPTAIEPAAELSILSQITQAAAITKRKQMQLRQKTESLRQKLEANRLAEAESKQYREVNRVVSNMVRKSWASLSVDSQRRWGAHGAPLGISGFACFRSVVVESAAEKRSQNTKNHDAVSAEH